MAYTTPTYSDFITRFCQFADVAQESVTAQLALSIQLLDGATWDEWYAEAVMLDAAHNLFLDQQASATGQGASAGTAGPVTSVSGAGLSIGFASPSWNDKSKSENWYMKTIYGQKLLRLWEVVIPAATLSY
jgi:hypothetical protein